MTLEQYEAKVANVILDGVAEIIVNSVAKGDEEESEKLFIFGLAVTKVLDIIRSNLFMGKSEVEPDAINRELDDAVEMYVEVMEDAPDFFKDLGVVLADIFERARVKA